MAGEDEEQGEAQGVAIDGGYRTPPYIAFQTFLTFLTELKTNGIPPQVDRSVLRRFAGGMQGQIKMAARSLGLLDGDKPTAKLKALVDAHETPQFEAMLLDLLHETYPYVFALDLMNATPTMFADAFKATGAKEDVSRKCRTFFLHAAKRAGVPLGPRILTGSVPRSPSASPGKRKRPKAKDAEQSPPGAGGGKADNPPPPNDGVLAQLLDKFPEFDPKWPDGIKAKWFEGFEQFMKGAQGQ